MQETENDNHNVRILYPNQSGVDLKVDVEVERLKQMIESIYTDSARLWEKEGQLIRIEMHEKFSDLKNAALYGAFGGAILSIAFVAAVASGIIGMSLILPLWKASLIVTSLLIVLGVFMLYLAKKKMVMDELRPERSLQTLAEIRQNLEQRIKEL